MRFQNALSKFCALPVVTGIVSVACVFPAFASGSGGSASAADWAPVITELTSQVNITNIMTALATFVAAGIGIVFSWWGLRKAIRSLMGAFRKGKLSI